MVDLIIRNGLIVDGTGTDPFTFRSIWSGFTHPPSMPATDTILLRFGRPSHVFYDCFPRFIEVFVNGRAVVEDGVFKKGVLAGDLVEPV